MLRRWHFLPSVALLALERVLLNETQLRALIVEMAVRRWVLGVLPLRSMCAFALMIVRVVRVRPPFAKGADS